jgi:anti-anti-sigma regulatory factor
MTSKRPMMINLADTWVIDARFLGLLMMLKKQVNERGGDVKLVEASRQVRAMFARNGAGFLLAAE